MTSPQSVEPAPVKEAHPLRSVLWIVGATLVGVGLGQMLGARAAPLGQVGSLFVQLIKAIAAPLLFFAIVEAMVTTEIQWIQFRRFLVLILINSSLALTIGLLISNAFQPGRHLSLSELSRSSTKMFEKATDKSADVGGFLDSLLPSSIVEPFAEGNILGIAFIAVCIGLALRAVSKDPRLGGVMVPFVEGGTQLFTKLITACVKLTPLAVMAVIAASVGTEGFGNWKGLALYTVLGLLGLGLQAFGVYSAWLLISQMSLRRFWQAATPAVLNAFGVNSSLASLELTLRGLDQLGVSKQSARMSACIGTNLNNDGILLYEGFAVLIIAQVMGQNLGLGDQLGIALVCVIATLGIAGIPEAGIISLFIIASTLKFDATIVLTLFTVDWILARMRSVTNVLADMTNAVVLDAWARRNQLRI